jgi:hypothetical protein
MTSPKRGKNKAGEDPFLDAAWLAPHVQKRANPKKNRPKASRSNGPFQTALKGGGLPDQMSCSPG